MAEMDTRSLRNVLGCFATGVAILTTRTQGGEHVAVTVNSFSSVSLAPPLILFSLVRTANILTHFQQAEHYAVNILAHTQESLSNLFARPSTAAWDPASYSEGVNGCALFGGCLAQLECARHTEIDGGDHRVFVAEVTQMHLHQTVDPLLFYRGRYGTYIRSQWDKTPPPDGSLSEFAFGGWG